MRKANQPVQFKPVFKQIYKHITQLITRFDDRFQIDVKNNKIITTFYGNTFHMIDLNSEENTRIIVEDGDNEFINE